jgi:hypothetical protein
MAGIAASDSVPAARMCVPIMIYNHYQSRADVT